MADDIARYRNLVVEANGGFDPHKILSHVSDIAEDSGVVIRIKVNKPFRDGIHLDDISMFVGFDEDDGESDLGLNYTIHGPDVDENELMDLFYEGGYDDELSQILMQAGFSADASQVSGSESGMQDVGRASYDAGGIADEVREAITSVPSSDRVKAVGNSMLARIGVDVNNPEPKKEYIIRWMLNRIKESSTIPFDVIVSIEALQQSGAKWTELDDIMSARG